MLRRPAQAHEHEPGPRLHADGMQPEVRAVEALYLGKVRRRAQRAVQAVRPRVVRALDGALEPTRRHRARRTARPSRRCRATGGSRGGGTRRRSRAARRPSRGPAGRARPGTSSARKSPAPGPPARGRRRTTRGRTGPLALALERPRPSVGVGRQGLLQAELAAPRRPPARGPDRSRPGLRARALAVAERLVRCVVARRAGHAAAGVHAGAAQVQAGTAASGSAPSPGPAA